MRRFTLGLFAFVSACSAPPAAQTQGGPVAVTPRPASPPTDAALEALIDQLQAVADPGIGYSPVMTGSEFLPAAGSGQQHMLVLGQPAPKRSNVMTKLVAAGPDAVPSLLAHLGDTRPTKLPPMRAMMWQSYADEYDFNRRTRTAPPSGVNRDDGPARPEDYTVTVGDLCFAALGQIVNRSFVPVRYQPSGGLIVSSPSRSKALRDTIVADRARFVGAAHRDALIADFRTPDHAHRREGALRRLAYYYPDTLETVVEPLMAEPVFDSDEVHRLARDQLYKAPAGLRVAQFNRLVRRHGKAAADGLQQMLFDDLDTLEALEQGRLSPPTLPYGTQPRELLVSLFDWPPSVVSTDRPWPNAMSNYEHQRLREILKSLGEAD